jgi:hypothetical protein
LVAPRSQLVRFDYALAGCAACGTRATVVTRHANKVATRPHMAANINHIPATARLPEIPFGAWDEVRVESWPLSSGARHKLR